MSNKQSASPIVEASQDEAATAVTAATVVNAGTVTPVAVYNEEPTVITSVQSEPFIQQEISTQAMPPKKEKKSIFGMFGFLSQSNVSPPEAVLVNNNMLQVPVKNLTGISKTSNISRPTISTRYPRRIMTEGWDTKPPCAVIVTIYSQSSYDSMFRSVPQQSPDPESSIAVFEMDYDSISFYLQYINHHGRVNTSMMPQNTIDAIKDVVDAINNVESDAVVFNFECCGFCSDEGFKSSRNAVHELLKNNIDAGYMTMFGDFSVKALISSWDTSLFGPIPFERIQSRSCSNSMLLAFDCAKLLECPSAQLQNIGKLHEGINTAELHCMGGTVVFTMAPNLEKQLAANPLYKVDVLTIATKIDGEPVHGDEARLTIDRYSGHAGHVLLTYNNEKQGKILVSAGHWIELSQMGAETERVFTAMREQYGDVYEQQLRSEYNSANSEEMRTNLVQRNVRQLVQSSAPCNYSRKKY